MKKKGLTTYLLALTLFVCVFSCQKEDDFKKSKPTDKEEIPKEPEPAEPEPPKATVISNPWNNNPYKLNVVYFVPEDVDTIFDYKKRISGVVLQVQKFYAEGLSSSGFGNQSFGLNLLSDTEVDIITFHSKIKKSEMWSGYQRAIREVNEYFSANPDRKKSEHTLIITPSFSEDPKNPGGPPFFGVGKFCFALDYPDMKVENLGISGIDGDLATKWIGGLAHELGHGLNAPHNKEHKTEKPIYGTALMGAGNYTYGKEKTYLTKSSAALFSTCQVFATEKREDWYRDVKHNLIRLKGEYDDDAIIISGEFYSSTPVSAINVYHDREPHVGNDDYDALSWTTKPVKNLFSVKCPLKEFYNLSGKYMLKIDFYHENGTKKGHTFYYEFDDNEIPKIEVINTKNIKDRTGWEIIETDSEQNPENLKENILDGDVESVWHTKWKGGEDPLPHHFVVDMKSEQDIDGFGFATRNDINGAIKDFEVFKSSDNRKWTSIGKFTLKAQKDWQYIDLPKTETMRYVKIKVISTNKDRKFTHLGEFVAY